MNKIIWLLLLAAITNIVGGAYAVENPENWNVKVGGESSDMSLQGLRFYPGIITINEGDNITWTVNTHEFHTVSFLTGEPPMPGSPESLSPMGGSTFDGSVDISSGIMSDSAKYTLTFTKAGTFEYMCLIHPGMTGVVIVNPAGTPYPFTQKEYDTIGEQEFSLDLAEGTHLMNDNLNVENIVTPGPNNNEISHVNIDIPLPTNATVFLKSVNKSGISGKAKLDFLSPGQLQVSVELKGMGPENTNTLDISLGKSGGPVLFPLNDIVADAKGSGNSTTTIEGPQWFAIANKGWFIDVLSQTGETLATGSIVKHDAALLRFEPQTITIKEGDMVEWKQLNNMMIHTVSFLEANQTPPEFIINDTINPDVSTATVENINNGVGFINSGILEPGDTFDITFMVPGTYKYVCLIHDEMKMTGTIKVLPTNGIITGRVINDLNGNKHLDINETGLLGWTINLLGIVDNKTQVITNQTTTDENGDYMFDNLPLGKYFISEELQSGFIPMSNPAVQVDINKPKISKHNFFNKPTVAIVNPMVQSGGGNN